MFAPALRLAAGCSPPRYIPADLSPDDRRQLSTTIVEVNDMADTTPDDQEVSRRLRIMLIMFSAVLLSCGGCIGLVFFVPSYSEHTDVTSARTDAQGKIVEEFIRVRHDKRRGWVPGPHGPVPWEHEVWFTNHLREPYHAPRELTFLRDEQQAWMLCKPVPDSNLWAVYCQDPVMEGPCKFRLLVFDDTHIVRRRQFQGITETNYECRALFEDGNRKFVYIAPNGVEAYDILTNTTKPWTGSIATRKNINGRYEDVTLHPPFPTFEPTKPAK
jgi:hypothetical protein